MYYFKIMAFNSEDKKTNQVMEYCLVSLYAESPTEALKRAKSLVKKKFYHLREIIEEHDHSRLEDMQLLQLEIQKRQLDESMRGG